MYDTKTYKILGKLKNLFNSKGFVENYVIEASGSWQEFGLFPYTIYFKSASGLVSGYIDRPDGDCDCEIGFTQKGTIVGTTPTGKTKTVSYKVCDITLKSVACCAPKEADRQDEAYEAAIDCWEEQGGKEFGNELPGQNRKVKKETDDFKQALAQLETKWETTHPEPEDYALKLLDVMIAHSK